MLELALNKQAPGGRAKRPGYDLKEKAPGDRRLEKEVPTMAARVAAAAAMWPKESVHGMVWEDWKICKDFVLLQGPVDLLSRIFHHGLADFGREDTNSSLWGCPKAANPAISREVGL